MFTSLAKSAVALLFALSPICAGSVVAGERDWAQKPFGYVAIDQSLRDLLREFAAAVAVPLDVSDAVRGQVSGRWPEMPADRFLGALTRSERLESYFDGATLFVSAASENASRMLPLHGATLDQVGRGLEHAGWLDDHFSVRPGPTPGVALVSGPPRFLSVVQQTIDAIADTPTPTVAQASPPPTVVTERRMQVFRGSAVTSVVLR